MQKQHQQYIDGCIVTRIMTEQLHFLSELCGVHKHIVNCKTKIALQSTLKKNETNKRN